MALAVDELVGREQILVKPFEMVKGRTPVFFGRDAAGGWSAGAGARPIERDLTMDVRTLRPAQLDAMREIEMAGAVLSTSYINFGDAARDHVFCVNTIMRIGGDQLSASFQLVPDPASLQVVLRQLNVG
jgi:hypothetical protein